MTNAKKITSICPAHGWRAGFFDEDGIYLEPVLCWALVGGVIRGVVYTGDCIEFTADNHQAENFLGFLPPGEDVPDRWSQRIEAEVENGDGYMTNQQLSRMFGDPSVWICSSYAHGESVASIAAMTDLRVGDVFRIMGERRREYERTEKARKECLRTRENADKSHATS